MLNPGARSDTASETATTSSMSLFSCRHPTGHLGLVPSVQIEDPNEISWLGDVSGVALPQEDGETRVADQTGMVRVVVTQPVKQSVRIVSVVVTLSIFGGPTGGRGVLKGVAGTIQRGPVTNSNLFC